MECSLPQNGDCFELYRYRLRTVLHVNFRSTACWAENTWRYRQCSNKERTIRPDRQRKFPFL